MSQTAETTIQGTRLITHSSGQCANQCLRKYFYMYVLGIRLIAKSRALRMGGIFHLAMQLWDDLRKEMADASLEAIRDEIEGRIRTTYSVLPNWIKTHEQLYDWQIECETVVMLFKAHLWYWGNQEFEVIATEQAFELPIINPETNTQARVFRKAGKLDRIISLRPSVDAVQEYKTCSEDIGPGSDYWKHLRIDSQISGYLIAAQEKGYVNVCTVLYDVTRKPRIEPSLIPDLDEQKRKIVVDENGVRQFKKDGTPYLASNTEKGWKLKQRRETPDEFAARLREDIISRPEFYFARQEVARTENDLIEYKQELWQRQKMLMFCHSNNSWPRNTGACRGKHGRCDYFDICTGGAMLTADSPIPDGFERVEDLHPELKN